MIKHLLLISFFLVLTVSLTAQWTNTGAWPNANFTGNSQGMAVDPDGKVWCASYYVNGLDSIPKGDGTYLGLQSVFVFNADGTPASFSPIRFFTYNGVTDTANASVRGMVADVDGNIIYANGWWRLYKLDYKTGEVLAKVDDIGFAPTKPASDAAGNIYMAPVVPGNPVKIYDKDLNYTGNAVESVLDYGRATEVSADGNTIYVPRFGLKKVIVYQRPDEFSSYDSVGTILDGAMVESILWHPVTKLLWVSCGSFYDKPTDPKYTVNTWYALDVTSSELVDSLKWEQTDPALANDLQERPRTIAFSPDGKTAYVGCFNNAKAPMIQKVVQGATSVEKIDANPTGYKLAQNYPNPFNPNTTISFSIEKAGFSSLKVYDVLGNEVAVLLNEEKGVGTYTVSFDASNLTSGTYFYILTSGNYTSTNKMLLLK